MDEIRALTEQVRTLRADLDDIRALTEQVRTLRADFEEICNDVTNTMQACHSNGIPVCQQTIIMLTTTLPINFTLYRRYVISRRKLVHSKRTWQQTQIC